ncbi:MAG: dihydrolipoamide acetyltransferase family protein [Nocardioides sp.]|uniref:dihydrolipoamide acetyltransferase family protein n=1 Tax=Nocardioides sp. TaxID=35761 RepID=UPI00238847AD|nr:dihydrolipoamide acetyltransferase family protein [Nocardioides sp.]MDE0777761.1 dihydrolipoamide acetyltransferase family protein [Nocardioides sp.]
MPEYKLPDVGEGLTEAEIVTWKVKVGDVIAINDIVVEIETAKSLVELPSPYAGEVTALLVPEGETVEVGTPIIAIGEPSAGAVPSPAAAPGDAAEEEIDLSNPAASGGGEGESLVGRNKADRGAVRRARKAAPAPATKAALQGAFTAGDAADEPVLEEADQAAASGDLEPAVPAASARTVEVREPAAVRVLAKPPVRKLAKDLGVDLTTCAASGPGGSITRGDVEGAAEGHADGGAAGQSAHEVSRPLVPRGTSTTARGTSTTASAARETREPVKGVRKMMAGAMVGSAFSAPHVTEWVTIDATASVELVERLKARREFRDVKVSPLLVLAKAVLLAMRRAPEINSWWDEAAQEVVYKHYVNLGIAAATPRGLVVPNIKDADQLSLVELAEALGTLTATARDGRTQPAEMADGTFTITNVGVFGVDAGTPIINPGESAILCFGAITKQPWVVARDGADEIAVRHVTTLALSFDHRHVDGEKGSRFLADVAGIVEDPGSALLF